MQNHCYRCGKQTNLKKCKHCNEYFCEEHLPAKMCLTRAILDDKKLHHSIRAELEKEWRKEGGHPDAEYTSQRWKKFERREKEYHESVNKFLDASKIEKTIPVAESPSEENFVPINPLKEKSYKTADEIWEEVHPKMNQRNNKENKSFKSPSNKIIILMIIFAAVVYFMFFATQETKSNISKSLENYKNVLGCPYDYKFDGNECKKIQRCSDGTVYGECSYQEPLFCLNGSLVNKASKCGCSVDNVPNEDACVSKYMTNPKTANFDYILRGMRSQIVYTVYGGLSNYLSSLPRSISYYENQIPPTDIDFIRRNLNNDKQSPMINPLVEKIQNITSNKDDQARIAISLVQNIDYDQVGLDTGNIYGKYPYEVMYTGSGVCSEKAQLLAYMLRGLGYGVAIFRFNVENHDAVGIKCPQSYSYINSGYCFVESTTPSIVTDSSGDYAGVGKLTSTPVILKISEGNSFDSVSEEYNDAITYNNIINMGPVLDDYNYNNWLSLSNKYGMKTT